MTEKRPLTLSLFAARLLSGFVGGIAGTLALFITFFILNSLIPSTDETTSLSVFIVIVMAFIGTLISNIVTSLMVTFVDSAKYNRRKTTLVHVFMFNLIFVFLSIPFYLMGAALDIVTGVAAVHLVLSAFISALLMEIIAGYEYSLLGIYSATLGVLVSIGIAFVALTLKIQTTQLIFMAMPIIWIVLEITGGFAEWIYDSFVRLYGIEALNIKTDLGGDAEKEPKDENAFEEGVDKEDGK
ncbi:hypothetical protein HZA43_05080 [Candidatus Peregrinibacteria bacterium]|nr:hypothetical protein [Candidatus Peregrinibacteria bacterium]